MMIGQLCCHRLGGGTCAPVCSGRLMKLMTTVVMQMGMHNVRRIVFRCVLWVFTLVFTPRAIHL